MNEFELIERYFRFSPNNSSVSTGIGDDAAVILIDTAQMAVSVDTLVSGVHFPLETSASDVAYKALAVNLSDMAAMGATPRYFTLSLVLPEANAEWLQDFSESLAELAEKYGVALIGGDTTKGPLTISIQIIGELPDCGAVLRSTAGEGEDIYVSGNIGDAAVGLLVQQGAIELPAEDKAHCMARLNRPKPRVELGQSLLNIATAMIDCSDGFSSDLGHILQASNIGAEIELSRVPLSPAVARWLDDAGDVNKILSGGDDYELIFTAEKASRKKLKQLSAQYGFGIRRVGETFSGSGLKILDTSLKPLELSHSGYNHFSK